jgi:Uma2 family endonuclease
VSQIAGRQVDLTTDPPPDLVIEVDISSPSSRRIDIYRQLGVPEIWRYATGRVQFHQLTGDEYIPCDPSPTFPFVTTIEQVLDDDFWPDAD